MCEGEPSLRAVAIIVMGVSGAGKSTVAQALAESLRCAFIEGDELHTPSNIAKMKVGQPLTDEDRFPWLERVGTRAAEAIGAGRPVVISCSALKRRYRDQLRARIGRDHVFVYLSGTREMLLSRLGGRHGHFMPASLLDSQLETLEPPFDEQNVLTVDISTSPDRIAGMVAEHITPTARTFAAGAPKHESVDCNRMTKPKLLAMCEFPAWDMLALRQAYEVLLLPEPPAVSTFLATHGQDIRAVATAGSIGISADMMAGLPGLEMIACYGVGTDAIDLAYARSRNIRVTNTPDVLNDDVADLAMGLLIAAARRMAFADSFVRNGNWKNAGMPLTTRVSGKRLGVVGMGRIGQAIARRAAGFDLELGYHTRSANPDLPYTHFPNLLELAEWCDFMVVIVPGGEATKGLISEGVIAALGPEGILVNVSRGSVVDETALLDALESGRLRAAGLDVFATEPCIDARFERLDNIVLQPHHGSGTIETRQAMGLLMRQNLEAYFAGKAPPTPVAR